MDKRTLALGALVGTGVAVVCVPDIKAYRRLGAITRSLRAPAVPNVQSCELPPPADEGTPGL